MMVVNAQRSLVSRQDLGSRHAARSLAGSVIITLGSFSSLRASMWALQV